MIVVSTPYAVSLIFKDKEDMQSIVNGLVVYLNDLNLPDNEVRVFSIGDTSIDPNKIKQEAYTLKRIFSEQNDKS